MFVENWTEYTRFIVALLVILDPFFVIPIYLNLTKNYSLEQRKRIVTTASLTVAVVLILSALSGEALLTWMGTSLGSVPFLLAPTSCQSRTVPYWCWLLWDSSVEAETLSGAADPALSCVPPRTHPLAR